jgi:hypothetical protein
MLVEQGYELGVPMGGDLPSNSSVPTFTVHATKDPDGANLDRVQIIKGWVDTLDNTHEKIVDAVWSGDRKPDANGKLLTCKVAGFFDLAKYVCWLSSLISSNSKSHHTNW